MSDQNPMQGEGDWGDPVPPNQPQNPPQNPPQNQPPPYGQQPPGGYPQQPPPSAGYPQQPPPSAGYPAQGYPPQGYPQGSTVGGPPKVDNFLIPSILATILCCLPTGIAAIVFASQVNTKLSQGDLAGARASAAKARMWTFISVGAGVVVLIVYVIAAAGTS